jgi:hypothetical protein
MNTQWELALLQLRIWIAELRSAPARGGMSDEISYTAVAVGGAIAVGAIIVAALVAKAEGISF